MGGYRIRGVGLDAVKIGRINCQRMSRHIIARLFHPLEVSELLKLKSGQEEFLASRYAAKEALVKALGSGFRGIYPSDIAVVTNAAGAPSFKLSAQILQRFNLEEALIHLSLTHEASLALAFVVVEEHCG